jgi:hypothetical protein
MRATSVVIALAMAALAAGCSNDRRPAEWSYLSPTVFQPNCASQSCHSRSAAVAGLDFSDPDRGYKSLTTLWVWVPNPTETDLNTLSCGKALGEEVCEQRLRPLVTPYDPNESRLVNMLRARGASRMPPDRPLDESDIELVEQWILDGAKRYPSSPSDGAAGDASVDAGVGADAAEAGAEADASGDGTLEGGAGQDASANEGGGSMDGGGPSLTSLASDGWHRVSGTGTPPAGAQSMVARLTLLKPMGSARAEAKFDDALVAAHGTSTQLLTNGTFDSDLAGWQPTFETIAKHDPMDAKSNAASGSLDLVMSAGSPEFASLVAAIQCVPATAGTSYDIQADVYVVPGQTGPIAAGVDLWYYASTDCSGSVVGMLATGSGGGH